jgi:hypothetical protein
VRHDGDVGIAIFRQVLGERIVAARDVVHEIGVADEGRGLGSILLIRLGRKLHSMDKTKSG